MASFDSIVIGGGYNGLACAAYLGCAGQRVAVVEARGTLGGFTTSEAPFSNHPDVKVPMASMDIATANLPPSIIDALEMRKHSLQLVEVDPFYNFITPDGTSLLFWRHVEKTCTELERISREDATAYRDFTADMTAFWRVMAPYMHAHPTRPGIVALTRMALSASRAPKRLARAARFMLMSPQAIIETTFRSPALQAALANFAAASTAPLDQPGTGIILAVMAMQHECGVILARAVRTPEDIQSISGIERGCAYHADMTLAQMGPGGRHLPWPATARRCRAYGTPALVRIPWAS